MFLLNRGSSLKFKPTLDIDGIVATASGLNKEQLKRQKTLPTSKFFLFDPQLYFHNQPKDKYKKLFNTLSSYSWYNPNPPEFDSTVINITTFKQQIKDHKLYNKVVLPKTSKQIQAAINSCLDYQTTLGVNYYILPTTLVCDPEDCFSEQLKWINEGISLSKGFDKPKLISLCISEDILKKKLEENTILQTIIDNLTTYESINGFYISLARKSDIQYMIDENVISSILELCYHLGHNMDKQIFLNSLDTLGFLGLAVGASSIISGYTNKEKRLFFNDYIDRDKSGAALPHFYSFSFIGDLFSDRDMSKINQTGMLNLMSNDITIYSKELFDALKKNISVAKTDWKETKNNVTLAKLHRYELLATKTHELLKLDMSSRISYVKDWLNTAIENISKFESTWITFHPSYNTLNPLNQNFDHIKTWQKCFDEFTKKYNLI